MANDIPIACTLSASDYRRRLAEIAALSRDALRHVQRRGLTLDLRYAPEAVARVRQLVAGRLRPLLEGDFDLRLFAASDIVREIPTEEALTGDGRGSDLGGAVTAMAERAAAGEFVGMVLVSDGARL